MAPRRAPFRGEIVLIYPFLARTAQSRGTYPPFPFARISFEDRQVPLHCPHCQHSMVVKDAKPGKYKPKCARCGERFALTVFSDASQKPLVEKLPDIATAPTVLYPPAEAAAVPAAPPTPPAEKTVANNPQVEATMASSSPPAAAFPAASRGSSEKTV